MAAAVSRKDIVKQQLQDGFKEIETKLLPKLKKLLDGPRETDACTLYLRGKQLEIDGLKDEVSDFRNPGRHFTKQYRTFEGYCSKLQTDIDRIEKVGRDDLKDMRKKAHGDLNTIIEDLASKVHGSGAVCDKCEVKS